jgi:four helix bundle protein
MMREKSFEPARDLRSRTKEFALRIIRLVSALPKTTIGRTLGNQLLRSGTSVGANYREAMHGRSRAEFLAKLEIALQEMEETCYWLELIVDANLISRRRLDPLIDEANQILAILIASARTTKQNRNTPK